MEIHPVWTWSGSSGAPLPVATVAATPTATPSSGVHAGATAECKDGTYSYSQHHSGTCSHHGGVLQWYS